MERTYRTLLQWSIDYLTQLPMETLHPVDKGTGAGYVETFSPATR